MLTEKWDKEEDKIGVLGGAYKSGFEIQVEDMKVEFLMTRILGTQMALSELAYQLGKDSSLLEERLGELYPHLDFKENGWAFDLSRKVIKKR